MAETYGFRKLISYILIVVVLVLVILYMYGGEGALTNLKEKVLGIAPNVSLGADKELADKPTVLAEHQEQINELKTTIQAMLDSDKSDCFSQFSGFSDLTQGDTSAKIVLSYDGDKTRMFVYGGAGGIQEVTELTTELAMVPCVIGGTDEIREGFISRYLSDEEREIEGEQYYNILNGTEIAWSTKGINQNRINGEKFHGDEWLFKAGDNVICFFPSTGDYLPKRYFEEDEEYSIPKLFSSGGLSECFAEDQNLDEDEGHIGGDDEYFDEE